MVIKKIVPLILAAVFLTFSAGCQSNQAAMQEAASSEDYEKLPMDQKESELDKALAKVRQENKKMKNIVANGYVINGNMSGSDIPGYIEPPTDHITESEIESIYNAAFSYLNEKGIELTDKRKKTLIACYDPRMNQIYKDKDKGVAEGYKNKDIYILEYETEVRGVYNYLLLVREADGTWRVLHEGNSYKE